MLGFSVFENSTNVVRTRLRYLTPFTRSCSLIFPPISIITKFPPLFGRGKNHVEMFFTEKPDSSGRTDFSSCLKNGERSRYKVALRRNVRSTPYLVFLPISDAPQVLPMSFQYSRLQSNQRTKRVPEKRTF
ncbi:hypothetical protein NPIL_439171 [Nephila pilipes]|uniref:Uncharacterized protein n=1 Tax=Nephila pilipes TaxID=299642 RepID=A0A8X6TAM2_NEPPI|nr:hypothetical protein NPIL_439171 [Nephila pilipes]